MESRWKCKIFEKSGWRNKESRWNQAEEITYKNNGNYKFKEWREVNIIENEHICKKLILHI